MKYKLSDICDVKVGFPFKSELFNENRDGIRLVRGMNVSCAGFRWGNQTRWWNYYTKDLEKYLLKEEDVLIAMDGNVSTNFVQVTKDDLPLLLVQRVARLRAKNVPQKIVWYIVKSHEFGAYLDSVKTGTTISHISAKQIGDYEIDLPDYLTQEKISSILSILDDKIRLNNKINNNLEQQALSIFYNLFAGSDDSMETELGYIPRTFSVTKVGQLPMIVTDYVANGSFASLKENVNLYQEPNFAYFIRNTDLKADSFGVYVDKHSYEFLSKSTLFGGEIIISNVGDVGSVHLCPVLDRPMTLGNNIIMLRPNEELRYYLYIWFKYAQGQSLIQGIKGGSAQPKFNKTDFKSLPIAIPNDAILCSFSSVVSPMFALINSNKMENNRLIKIRDSILPCLMTGEIDVSEVEF